MKSLKIIQVIAKVARVLCLIAFIASIVGASCCLLGLIFVNITRDVVVYEGKTVEVLIAEKGVPFYEVNLAMVVGLIVCGVTIFIMKYIELFLKKEIALGTPFDRGIIKDMRKLAIVHIITTVATATVIAIVTAIFLAVNGVQDIKVNLKYGGTIWFGLSLLLLSLFCEYGAERDEELKNKSQLEVIEDKPEEK